MSNKTTSFDSKMDLIKQIPFILIPIFLYFPHKYFGYGVGTLFIFWLVSNHYKEKFELLKANKTAQLMVVFFFLHLVSWLYTKNIEEGSRRIQTFLTFLIFPMLIPTYSKKINIEYIKISFVIITCLVSILTLYKGLINYFATSDISNLYYHSLANNVGFSGIYLALYVSFAILILLINTIDNWSTISIALKFLYLIVFLFLMSMLLLLSSKMIIAATFISIIVYFIKKIFETKYKVKAIIILVIFSVSTIVGILNLKVTRDRFANLEIKKFNYTDVDLNGYTGRIAMWTCAKDVIKENFMWGVGIGDAKDDLIADYRKKDFRVGYYWGFDSHNQYIETTLTLGIVGLILLLIIYFNLLKIAIQNKDILFIAFLIIFYMFSITESTLTTLKGISFFAFFASIFISSSNKNLLNSSTSNNNINP